MTILTIKFSQIFIMTFYITTSNSLGIGRNTDIKLCNIFYVLSFTSTEYRFPNENSLFAINGTVKENTRMNKNTNTRCVAELN